MDPRSLTTDYTVSPQIELSDLSQIKAAGYVMVIDNRPDQEIPEHLHANPMRDAAEAIGLVFVANPVIGGALTMDNVNAQAAAVTGAKGPVFAYCASGNRCSILWAMMNAAKLPVDELIATPARFGYNLEGLRGQLVALAKA